MCLQNLKKHRKLYVFFLEERGTRWDKFYFILCWNTFNLLRPLDLLKLHQSDRRLSFCELLCWLTFVLLRNQRRLLFLAHQVLLAHLHWWHEPVCILVDNDTVGPQEASSNRESENGCSPHQNSEDELLPLTNEKKLLRWSSLMIQETMITWQRFTALLTYCSKRTISGLLLPLK